MNTKHRRTWAFAAAAILAVTAVTEIPAYGAGNVTVKSIANTNSEDYELDLSCSAKRYFEGDEDTTTYFYVETDYEGDSVTLVNADDQTEYTMLDDGKFSIDGDDLPLDGVYSYRMDEVDTSVATYKEPKILSFYAITEDGVKSETITIKISKRVTTEQIAEMSAASAKIGALKETEEYISADTEKRMALLYELLMDLSENGTEEYPHSLIFSDTIVKGETEYSFMYAYGFTETVSVLDNPFVEETTTSTTKQTTTTTTTMTTEMVTTLETTTTEGWYESQYEITIDSVPDKENYDVGEKLDLTGLTVSLVLYDQHGETHCVYDHVSPSDYPEAFVIDDTAFDSSKTGDYTLTISCTEQYQSFLPTVSQSFIVHVNDSPENVFYYKVNEDYVTITGSKLKSIEDIPDELEDLPVKELSSRAFFACANSESSITIPETVEVIGDECFLGVIGSGYTTYFLPASIQSIGDYALGYTCYENYQEGCVIGDKIEKLKNVVIYGYSNTVAETYAKENDFTFVALNDSVSGDVNNDGNVTISDAVLLQKWLLSVPDTTLPNWKAADLYEDERLNVFDLCLLKRMLIEL